MLLENHKLSFDGKIPVPSLVMEIVCLILSMGLVGHDKLATEIRVRTCLELSLIGTRTMMDRMLERMIGCFMSLTVLTRPVPLLLGKAPFRLLGQCFPRQLFLVARSSLYSLLEMDFLIRPFDI